MSASKALALGAISGLRSMSGPAFLSRAASDGRLNLEGTSLAFLGSPRVSKALMAMELGELVADKLPIIPSRSSPPVLLGRAAAGALVGAALFASEERRITTGAAVGASAAAATALAGERLRVFASQKTGLPDPLFGLAEDAIVLLVGLRSLREAR